MSINKKLLPSGLTRENRTEKLNQAMRNVKPEICIERARLITQSYRSTEGMPYIIRRAIGLKDLLENMTIFIEDEELIVGNHGSKPRCAPLFPEFGGFSKEELDRMPTRKVDTLQITEADKAALLTEIYPYWENKSIGDLSRHYIDERIMKVLDSPYRVFNPLSRARSGYGHYLPDIQKIISHGFRKVEEEAKDYLESLDILDPEFTDKTHFYKAVLIVCEGIRIFQNRYADLAEQMAAEEGNKRRKQELLLIASNCRHVPYEPARTYYEALQSYWFTLLIDYCGQNGSAISGGRVDQMFYPYYKNDLENGIMVKEEARELLEALWVKSSDVIKAGTYMSARNNGGFATTINVVLGGVDKNGENAVNDFTYVCLDAEQTVFNSEPNTSIRISQKNPDKFLNRVLQILVENEGGKLPFFNDDLIIDGLMKDGVSLEDARNYAIVGCVEPTGQGNTMGRTNACYFNLAKCLELALFNGVCQMSGEQMGPATGKFEEFETFDELKKAYEIQVNYFVDMMISSLNSIELLHARYGQHIYCSMLLEGCLEKGRDCTQGGAKYDYAGVQGVGIADVGDSLMAIKTLIFDKKEMAPSQLLDALRHNFEGQEILKYRLINQIPKYGNDIPEADEMTAYVGKQYCKSVKGHRSPYGAIYRPGLFCLSSNTPLGRQVCALPSGREAGTPLGDGGISPKHGMDICGPTAAVKSVARVDHGSAINGVNFNMKFMPTILRTKEERQKLIDLIRTYFAMGGMHIQFNILTPDKLKDAQQNPDRHRNLVVRVAGYSAFFVELDKDIQDEIISRTMQCV
ncbi:formate C-acetyltransferase/glycerol dehydratase family glycyl radical enzyme [Eubacterium sp. am_0171]|uniref:4-hydroxyphenylacetate decarboxylase large subunit n=1 Tax=Faecalicatena contorta TaxID=39482 RepID=A0A174A6N2_9FIRM|nr:MULTISPECIES: formate C-acetyltransferase/glycerol dehydratase family glycyl radical enzyme [Clostridia]MSC82989.1 formate C-acetyltransferase/glycerol dehydratase family glycyl radical enzyme [Eubacterium sp. BIOML-A1]MSD04582.1 formate C-acetyltransferase/glycerol dehydratase family glycyl radical enzyme [Eubacterium sp. BIOML-A2]RYT25762.1 formate C-acetyltransferase/glycerol dehydratase family glycyl radical enzyme [Eubacterium sp. am_0171]CUN83176.1 4-hydroxyphenylacetate decarboxylase 